MKFHAVSFLYVFALVAAVERVRLPDVDRQYMKELIVQENPNHTEVEADKAIYELENYYTGIRDGLFRCGPPRKIDFYYHLHVLNTHLYRDFCQATFGRFIEHEPFWSGNPTSNQKQAECGGLLDQLIKHGLNVSCPCLWRTSSMLKKAQIDLDQRTGCIVADRGFEV